METMGAPARSRLTLMAALFAFAAVFGGSASISDWGAAARAAPDDDAPSRADTAGADDEGATQASAAVGRATRRSGNCTGCGIVESVTRLDGQEPSSHEIVVRFHDGSRRVFREATARELRSGERVRVIAGMDLPAR